MTYAIAAAGTGGHVFPGLAVGEALVAGGVPHHEIVYLGGARLEATVYPAHGFPFLGVELRGLSRSFTMRNLGIPAVVVRAARTMAAEMVRRRVKVVLGMGGYVTIPAALAARRAGAVLAVSEQNAEAGLANALAGRLAARRFGAFPVTRRLPAAEWVGNPIREGLATFDRAALRPAARARYGLQDDLPVLGVFGGSLGADALNRAVEQMVAGWEGPPLQVLHLAGEAHAARLTDLAEGSVRPWRVLGFEAEMEHFYAATDLAVARAGGAVAELAATATPSILVPGAFGSGRHQASNAAAFADRGAAAVVEQGDLTDLPATVARLIGDPARLEGMAAAARSLAKPRAAATIAGALRGMHG